MPEERRWKREALALLLLAGVGTIVFAFTDLDLRVSGFFHHPDSPAGAWPVGRHGLWRLLDHAAPRLAIVLFVAGAGCILHGVTRPRQRRGFWTLRGLLIVLTLLLGPGLVVNIAGKNVWRRPRPHRTAGLGGRYAYVPPLVRGPHGRSFPSGDASVGFAYGALYYAARRRRPRAARVALAGSIALGVALGAARVASGAHFVSDVLWGGLLTWAVTMTVHYAVLAIPRREAPGAAPGGPPAAATGDRAA